LGNPTKNKNCENMKSKKTNKEAGYNQMQLRNPGCNVGGEKKIIDNQKEKKN